MFEYSPADISSQISALGPAMGIWLRTIGIANLLSVLVLKHIQARWVLAAILFIAVTNIPIFLSYGLIKLGSVPHLIVWVPLIVYLAREFRGGKIQPKTPFGIWALVTLMLIVISVVFDVRDTVQYILGDRAQMEIDPNAPPPYITLLAIVLSIFAVVAYSFGFNRRNDRKP
ncbi:MAG: hypothetical protein GKR90_27130 [Pseudomonadales bacterium]|nr:hypothetical protein [Pseudomonadales bacterium]